MELHQIQLLVKEIEKLDKKVDATNEKILSNTKEIQHLSTSVAENAKTIKSLQENGTSNVDNSEQFGQLKIQVAELSKQIHSVAPEKMTCISKIYYIINSLSHDIYIYDKEIN